jgi:hypothetical protein
MFKRKKDTGRKIMHNNNLLYLTNKENHQPIQTYIGRALRNKNIFQKLIQTKIKFQATEHDKKEIKNFHATISIDPTLDKRIIAQD